MNALSDIAWNADGRIEALTFSLQDENFALEAGLVREIFDLLPTTSVPGSPRMIAEVINFRGKIIPLADLRVAFGMPPAEATQDSRIVVIEFPFDGDNTLIGVKADKVHEVTAFEQASSEAPPRIGTRWRPEYVRCLIKHREELFILPNLQRIFSSVHENAAHLAAANAQ